MDLTPSVSPRAWGMQTDAVSLSAPLLTPIQIIPTALSNNISDTSFGTTHKEDKLPHHASVFVGSLPSNIDQGDLTRMLMDHLSEHTQVKNIKVVRDSKGGVCAFVQCEDPDSAAALIQTLHSGPPKLFLGRILRYEPARAFRTLLVSYRSPTKLVRPTGMNHLGTPYQGEIELELPHAMRMWKHNNSRFHSLVYNSDAIRAAENCDPNSLDACAPENALFLRPLEFNEDTLRKLVSYFGRLEKFSLATASKADEENFSSEADADASTTAHSAYPQPHNAPRASIMDQGCWEVKWEHRDACVSALMTLRRVPHLTVTWAHQPASTNQPFSPNYQPNCSPSYSHHARHGDLSSVFSASPNGSIGAHPRYRRSSKAGVELIDVSNPTFDRYPSPAASEGVLPGVQDAHDKVDGAQEHDALTEVVEQIHKLEITDSDFHAAVDGDSLPLLKLVMTHTTLESASDIGGPLEKGTLQNADHSQDLDEDEAQDLYMPQTPALDASSITPLTAGSQFPITPASSAAEGHMYYDNFDAKEKAAAYKGSRVDKEIDPTTLFVGGLEMFGPGAWDEEKVRNFFTRFGGLESVKLVRPLNSCSAFAFVKFNNAEAPARAVFEEHNRVYEGRAMRVQLRDCNPPRNWKYGHNRGRGRPQAQFGPQRRFHYRPTYDGQGQPMPLHLQKELTGQNPSEGDQISDIHLSTLAGPPSSSISRSTLDERSVGTSSLPPPSSSDLSSVARQSPPVEKYREWYDEPVSPAHTPEPSSLGSSASMAGHPVSSSPYAFSVPHGPFFPPQPWVQPYMHQGPYQLPYYSGYPVYPPPGLQAPQQAHAATPSPDGSTPAVAQPAWPHMGMYTSYIPYPAVFPRPPVLEQGQVPQIPNQAPLVPTGFIQNEQGTLIPVYQPEALDQYMAGSAAATSTPVANQVPNTGPPRWGNASPYRHDMANIPPNSFTPPNQSHNRAKNAGFAPNTSYHFSDFQQASASTHHGSEASFNSPTPLYRRPGQRRESQQNPSSVRHQHNHPRPYNGRLGRGHMYNSGQNQPSDLRHPPASALPINKWNGGR